MSGGWNLGSYGLEQIGLYLPEVVTDIVTSPGGSRIYVAGRRAIYELDDRTERFWRPVVTSSPDIEASITKATNSFSIEATSLDVPIPAGLAPPLSKLHVGSNRHFLAQIDGLLFDGRLGLGGAAVEVATSAEKDLAAPFASLAVSGDGRVVYAVDQPEGRILRLDLDGPETPAEAILIRAGDRLVACFHAE